VDETDIGKILPDQDVVVTVAAYPNQPFAGRVLKIEPKAEEETTVTQFSVLVTINNEGGLLRPGMNAEVNIKIASSMDVPTIPTIALRTMRDVKAAESYLGMESGTIGDALRRKAKDKPQSNAADDSYQFGGRYWVLIDRDGSLDPVYVTTGITDLDNSEIRSGVSQGDKIVLLPSSGLIQSQERFKKFMGEIGGVPGMKGNKDEDE